MGDIIFEISAQHTMMIGEGGVCDTHEVMYFCASSYAAVEDDDRDDTSLVSDTESARDLRPVEAGATPCVVEPPRFAELFALLFFTELGDDDGVPLAGALGCPVSEVRSRGDSTR